MSSFAIISPFSKLSFQKQLYILNLLFQEKSTVEFFGIKIHQKNIHTQK